MSDDLLKTGLTIRGDVIGHTRSEAALAGATAFDRPFQELALRYCWGEIWGRPGLDHRTRSIVNLAMLAAMAKPNELRIHVRGALTNGVTKVEIQEIFLQATVYCGVPTAGEAFKVAREVFEEPDYAGLGGSLPT
ncbi:MAG: carboxymuconolactone decarboxylase family protein [Janthinobacterium lividum]